MASESKLDPAKERAAIALAGRFRGDEGQWEGYWEAAQVALEAATPLILSTRVDPAMEALARLRARLGGLREAMVRETELLDGLREAMERLDEITGLLCGEA
jgi:hypothetical protein